MSRGNEIARGIGVALLAWLGGLALMFGYASSGGTHGWREFTIQATRDLPRGEGLLAWGGAVAVWVLCVAALGAGVVGAVGAALAVVGSGLAAWNAAELVVGHHGDAFWLAAGLALWVLGVAVLVWARLRAAAAAPAVDPPRVA